MTRYQATDPAPYGLYLAGWPPDARFVGADGEPIEGRPGSSYVRVPGLVALLLAPVLGGLFVLTFPILIFAALALALWRPASKGMARRRKERGRVVNVRWKVKTPEGPSHHEAV